MKFGVIGNGSVGSATIHSLARYYDYERFDIQDEYPFESVLECDPVFICVPTPTSESGHLDCGLVESVIERLHDSGYPGTAVVKSTLRIGFMDGAVGRFPDMNLVYMPEFLRENNAYSWSERPDRIVIAGSDRDVEKVMGCFSWVTDVPYLRMSYLEAEIGKIAHNAYIASKVSFTNSVEMLSDSLGADANNVMGVIWADRRVRNSYHLRPYLGGYSGKCIPKDSREMEAALSDNGVEASMMEGIRRVNGHMAPSVMGSHVPVYVIIPTRLDDGLYVRAMDSVFNQMYRPDHIVVVHDGGDDSRLLELLRGSSLKYAVLRNRSSGLSGAVNTGLDFLREMNGDGKAFVALLDDDDYWDVRYLQNCVSFASDVGCSWVVSGIMRTDGNGTVKSPVPHSLSVHDFLIGNPNVQGSNMFVDLDLMCDIGGFSEDLPSCTDRDVCIRLLDRSPEVGFLFNHMVHHDCVSRKVRLSTPGNPRKLEGLQRFFDKYSNRMDAAEREAFIERAVKLFGADRGSFQ